MIALRFLNDAMPAASRVDKMIASHGPGCAMQRAVFHFITGAGSCRNAPAIGRALLDEGITLYSVLTPNVSMVLRPETLMDFPGNHWIRDYGEPPLDVFPFGTMLVAPCTFNTLNKLVAGIADNLATAMLGDAIGAGCPVVIAPGMNRGQWHNPRVADSIATLQDWGCTVIPPAGVDGDAKARITLAPPERIVRATLERTVQQ